MAKAIMIQGTTSNAGKSLLTAALCRIFTQDGYKTAPFKSQNMALNSFITKDGLEMGRAQVMQAEAAGIEPDVRMNPILLKPTSDMGSQVIVHGEVVGTMNAKEYFQRKTEFFSDVMSDYQSLAKEYDIIVIEGAGSPAEINLKSQDIVNMGMAKKAKAPVLIVGDIDRGGVFAALAGTMLLLDEEEKQMVKGTVINKFRGDCSILEPGLRQLEQITNVPVVGVVPMLSVDIDDEDSLSERFSYRPKEALVDIAVIRLPRISNFTDFSPLESMESVSLRYVKKLQELGHPDLIILPGTKNTMGDLQWLRECGLGSAILKHASAGKPVLGICGGYQMMGNEISDPDQVEHGGTMAGLGLLDRKTTFGKEKIRTRTSGVFPKVSGIFHQLSGLSFQGYEIHMGRSGEESPLICCENNYGTYLHGFFDAEGIAKTIIKALMKEKGISDSSIQDFHIADYKKQQYDQLADAVRSALDMDLIYRILEEGIE